MNSDQIDTPAVLIDLDKLARNIKRLQGYLDQHGIANRPHIKTHKIPAIAQMQLDAGAVGITCQKLDEVALMAAAGIEDIFLPYNIVGEAKLERLAQLAKEIRLSVTADSEFTVQGLATAARRAGVELPVLVEFDSGLGRCGVQSPETAADLARTIARAPGLRFGGLMTYPSNAAGSDFVQATRALLKTEGLALACVSGGGTPTMWQAHAYPDFTEYRAGTYIYGDRKILDSGAMALDECAFKVVTTVVSRPTADRGIVDGGSKTFSSDQLGLDGYGLILEYPEARFYAQAEEHGFVDFSACSRRPAIGERLTVIPNHCCVVTNLFDRVVGVRGNQVELEWPVAARGAVH